MPLIACSKAVCCNVFQLIFSWDNYFPLSFLTFVSSHCHILYFPLQFSAEQMKGDIVLNFVLLPFDK